MRVSVSVPWSRLCKNPSLGLAFENQSPIPGGQEQANIVKFSQHNFRKVEHFFKTKIHF